ncbi:recombination mediator RecR [Bradymonas sediminis]|uniref:Recombination protein RecR n=1 Tax=Bradymonas sediminis TaxID=1548548 RepID=A0A2Z4FGT0_9DELT|nr:recombination mediator RecR [Bradymonas sediminis]AWV88163.1 recombination protein RecR [Bradymonas sediminis]TDP77286.1 DNA replication and repair protein RecR [Bradymonas sediminis]
MKPTDPITRLVNAFARLPGVGERTASRLAFFILSQPAEIAGELAEALVEIKQKVGMCQRCCNLTDATFCSICTSPRRRRDIICVVENTPDLRAIENTGEFRGTYHVLHGLISPLEGVGPDDVHIMELLQRLEPGQNARCVLPGDADPSADAQSAGYDGADADQEDRVTEIIIATSPSIDGEATSLYLSRLIRPLGVRLTRIASGVPIGSELEYTDKSTLSRALSERRLL